MDASAPQPPAEDAVDIQPFVSALQDEDPHIRARSAEILGKLRNARAIAPLVDAIFETGNLQKFDRGLFYQKSVQDIAVEAVLDIGGLAAVERFEAMLQHEVRSWQLRGIQLLTTLAVRDRELRAAIIRSLQGVLQNGDLELRTQAIESLRAIIVDN